jgi:hypothetical protein
MDAVRGPLRELVLRGGPATLLAAITCLHGKRFVADTRERLFLLERPRQPAAISPRPSAGRQASGRSTMNRQARRIQFIA